MSKKLRLGLILVLVCLFIGSTWSFFSQWIDYRRGEALYEDALDRFVIPLPQQDETGTIQQPVNNVPEDGQAQPAGGQSVPAVTMDFDALAEINGDIVGWITIPDTNINYPLLQGDSNDEYLRHAYNGQASRMGSIFIDFRCAADMRDRHTIIYGHNMRNSTMFSRLLNYSSQSFYDSHRYFYIYTAEGHMKYEIFSAYMETLPSDSYTIGFKTDSGFGDFVSQLTAKTAVASNIFPGGADKVVTLSTCSSTDADNQRFIVHGYLIEDARDGSALSPDGQSDGVHGNEGQTQTP